MTIANDAVIAKTPCAGGASQRAGQMHRAPVTIARTAAEARSLKFRDAATKRRSAMRCVRLTAANWTLENPRNWIVARHRRRITWARVMRHASCIRARAVVVSCRRSATVDDHAPPLRAASRTTVSFPLRIPATMSAFSPTSFRKTPSRQGWLPPVTVLVLIAILMWQAATPARAETGEDFARQAGERVLGQSVPPLILTTIDGERLDLGVLRGRKAVYLKFWATWCGPCREQMPHFERTYRRAGSDLQVVAINIGFDDTVEQIRAFRRELGLTLPMVRDDGRLAELFGLRVTPQHVVIGKDGRIVHVGHQVDARLEKALAQARSAPASSDSGAAAVAQGGDRIVPTLRIGEAVPDFVLTTLEARPVALRDPARRRASVLVFLSPWCEGYFAKTRPQSSQQCRLAREQLVALGRDRRVRWVGVASGLWASEQDLREYRDQHRIPVPLVLDRDGDAFRRFGVERVPALIVVDTQGRVARRIEIGELAGLDLEALGGALTPSARAER
ncbi:TlpA family protein disulfide reductase [Lysobacter sp. CA199]|uniref:TlpA family protein disulfide reductase n=1 Tax=Lysobacter sp. CA199 TaxID=3455608 RepID=UPI003F8D122E